MNTEHYSALSLALGQAASDEDVRRVVGQMAGSAGMSVSEYLDRVTLQIAEQFLANAVSFDDAMGHAADLYRAFFYLEDAPLSATPCIWYEVYWALDEGEYGNPPERVVTPLLLEIVAKARVKLGKHPKAANEA
jgi:hypothetical protein